MEHEHIGRRDIDVKNCKLLSLSLSSKHLSEREKDEEREEREHGVEHLLKKRFPRHPRPISMDRF